MSFEAYCVSCMQLFLRCHLFLDAEKRHGRKIIERKSAVKVLPGFLYKKCSYSSMSCYLVMMVYNYESFFWITVTIGTRLWEMVNITALLGLLV